MPRHLDDSFERTRGSSLGGDVAAHVEAIVRAAEREARAAERAIEDRRRSAEEEAHRYLAAARLHVDAEAAARAARLEALGNATRRLADELSDAAGALTRELQRDDHDAHGVLPRTPWPTAAHASALAPPTQDGGATPETRPPDTNGIVAGRIPHPAPTVAAAEPSPTEAPNAARLVAIEMAVGGSSRAEVESHLLDRYGVDDPRPLLDDVFGAESHAASRLAWGEP